jgi:vitamin B12 transporter
MVGVTLRSSLVLLCFFAPNIGLAEDPVTVYSSRPETADQRAETSVNETLRIDDDPQLSQSVGALLDQGLGVRVQRSGSTGRRETVQIRGAASHQVAVYLGDIRLSPAGGGGVDLSTLPLHCLESVDIVRGAAGSTYGSGAQGGVLRLNPGVGGASSGAASLSLGSFGFGAVDVCAALGESRRRTILGGRLEAGVGDFSYEDVNERTRTRENNQHRRAGVMVVHQEPVGQSGQLSATIDSVYDQRDEPGSAEFPSISAASDDLRTSGGVSWRDASLSGGRWRAEATLDGSHRRYYFTDTATAFGQDQVHFRLLDSQVGARSQLSYEGASWHRPRLSLDGRYARADTGDDLKKNPQTHQRRRLAAVLDWTLYGGDSLRVFSAIRLDSMTGRDPIWIPQAGLVWAITPQLSIRGNLGRTFRDPSFDELYFQGAGITGDPNLKPEDGVGGDVGLRWTMRAAWTIQADVTAYANTFDRLILFVPIDAYRVRATDRFGSKTNGAETSIRLQAGVAWFKAGYHWQRAHFDDDGHAPLPHRPTHRVVTRVGVDIGSVVIHGGTTSQTSVTSDRFGLRTLPAYSLVDMGIRVALPHGLSMSFDSRNLLNRMGHFDSVHRPLPGRSYFVQAKWAP